MKPKSSLFPAHRAGFFILIAVALIFSACAPQATPTEALPPEPDPTEIQPEPTLATTEVPEPEFVPQEFVDALGHEVLVDSPPLRIVSLAPSVTESLFAIGAGDLVIGRTEYCDFPEEAGGLPTIGGFSAKSISIEAILDLEPDLVIGGSTRQAEVIDAVQSAGINTFVVQPGNVEEINQVILLLGNVTDNQEGADAVVAEMNNRLNMVVEKVSTIPEDDRLTVFYEVWHEPLMTTTSQTFIGELIQFAGGINVFAEIEEDYPSISAEQIIEFDPDVILGPSSHGDQLTVEEISSREGWGNLVSVQNEAIYIIEGNVISRSGPRIMDALEIIAEFLYPDYFGD